MINLVISALGKRSALEDGSIGKPLKLQSVKHIIINNNKNIYLILMYDFS